MPMKVAIHQPQYLPWLGYLAKWAAADLFLFLDCVQYEKNGWQNRNRIKARRDLQWLTVPVHARLGAPIQDVRIDASQPWPRRHFAAIRHAYAMAPCFAEPAATLAELYGRPSSLLADVAVASATGLARMAGIRVPAMRASELGVGAADPTGRLVELCRAVKADTYLSGPDGVRYMDTGRFAEAGIEVLVQRYEHPVYAQLHGAFVPNLSALDLVVMQGRAAGAILAAGNRWERLPAEEAGG
jgi:hypothetical protein